MSKNPAKYEVLIKQYLRSTLDISGKFGGQRRQINLHLEELDQFRPIRPGNAKDLDRLADLLDVIVIKRNLAMGPCT